MGWMFIGSAASTMECTSGSKPGSHANVCCLVPWDVLVSQARPFLFCSANPFQYVARANTESDRCCGTERVWLARLGMYMYILVVATQVVASLWL